MPKYIFFCFLLLNSLLNAGKLNHVDETKLNSLAIDKGFGYKYANLFFLKDLVEEIDTKTGYQIKVPDFIGISSADVQSFLKKHGFNMAEAWAKVVSDALPGDEDGQALLIKSKAFPKNFVSSREVFHKKLSEAFDASIDKYVDIGLDKFLGTKGLDEFLKKLAKGQRVMVRSSGREDTKELANAGGNDSIANVSTDPKSVLKAIKQVVVSYFSETSFDQRLDGGDRTIFLKAQLTPVVIQVMINGSEGQPLSSGVMFTEEPEGGIARLGKKDDNGKLITSGITIIQSAFGHGEGVVNSKVDVDTFLLSPGGMIYPSIRNKRERMVPSGEGKLELMENLSKLAAKPSLDRDAVKTLKTLADALEDFYLGPMDIEFVVDMLSKVIYVVQARPLVQTGGQSLPSYVADLSKYQNENIVSGMAIGIAGGASRLALGADEVIISNTINEALGKFYKSDRDKSKAVIVGKMAPSTSHEATQFRAASKPVTYLPDWIKVQHWLNKKGAKLLISPQQALVINWAGDQKSTKELVKDGVLKEGFAGYPIAARLSFSNKFAPQALFDLALLNRLLTLKNGKKLAFTPADWAKLTWSEFRHQLEKELLPKLANGSETEASISLATLLSRLTTLVNHGKRDLFLDEQEMERVALLLDYAVGIALDVKNTLATNNDTARRFAIEFLRRLLLQGPNPDKIEKGDSADELLKDFRTRRDWIHQAIKSDIRPNADTIAYLEKGEAAVNNELKNRWQEFVFALAKGKKEDKVKAGELVSGWLNLIFATMEKKYLKHDELFKNLWSGFSSDKVFLEKLEAKKHRLDLFNTAGLATPKNFKKLWEPFASDSLAYFLEDGAFSKDFRNALDLGKIAAIRVVNELVETFDGAIKAVTGSTIYKKSDKLEPFAMMLRQYLKLFEGLEPLVNSSRILYHEESPLYDYKSAVEKVLKKRSFDDADLQSSEGFDVGAFTIGTGQNLKDVQEPKTLEDAFTAIHRWLLVVANALYDQTANVAHELPPLLSAVKAAINGIKTDLQTRPGMTYMYFTDKGIRLIYDWTLVGHGVRYTVDYLKKDNVVELAAVFHDANMARGYFPYIGTYVKCLEVAGIFGTKDVTTDGKFTIIITQLSEEKSRLLSTVLAKTSEYSTPWRKGDTGTLDITLLSEHATRNIAAVIDYYKDRFNKLDTVTQEAVLEYLTWHIQDNKLFKTISKEDISGFITIAFASFSSPHFDSINLCASSLLDALEKRELISKEKLIELRIFESAFSGQSAGALTYLLNHKFISIEDFRKMDPSSLTDLISNELQVRDHFGNAENFFARLIVAGILNKTSRDVGSIVDKIAKKIQENSFRRYSPPYEPALWQNLLDKGFLDNKKHGETLLTIFKKIVNFHSIDFIALFKAFIENDLVGDWSEHYIEKVLDKLVAVILKDYPKSPGKEALELWKQALEKGLLARVPSSIQSILNEALGHLNDKELRENKAAVEVLDALKQWLSTSNVGEKSELIDKITEQTKSARDSILSAESLAKLEWASSDYFSDLSDKLYEIYEKQIDISPDDLALLVASAIKNIIKAIGDREGLLVIKEKIAEIEGGNGKEAIQKASKVQESALKLADAMITTGQLKAGESLTAIVDAALSLPEKLDKKSFDDAWVIERIFDGFFTTLVQDKAIARGSYDFEGATQLAKKLAEDKGYRNYVKLTAKNFLQKAEKISN